MLVSSVFRTGHSANTLPLLYLLGAPLGCVFNAYITKQRLGTHGRRSSKTANELKRRHKPWAASSRFISVSLSDGEECGQLGGVLTMSTHTNSIRIPSNILSTAIDGLGILQQWHWRQLIAESYPISSQHVYS